MIEKQHQNLFSSGLEDLRVQELALKDNIVFIDNIFKQNKNVFGFFSNKVFD